MKVLITGGSGQLGRALVATLPAQATTTCLDRAALDIADQTAVERAVEVAQPDLIINAAAYTAVDKAEADEDNARASNTDAPKFLALAAQKCGACFAHVSTDFVFDGKQSHPYGVTDATAPLGVYGTTKRDGERAVLAASPGALIVRTAWVYSQHSGNFVQTMLRLMAERDEVRVVADQIGTPTFARNLARAIWDLCGQDANGVFHYTDAGVASWYDFALAIQEEALSLGLLSRKVPIIPIATADYPTPAKRPFYSVLDKSNTTALIGAAPHWREALREMLIIQKENIDG
jgi:dTDP-4-dehydrorhamnose reductase